MSEAKTESAPNLLVEKATAEVETETKRGQGRPSNVDLQEMVKSKDLLIAEMMEQLKAKEGIIKIKQRIADEEEAVLIDFQVQLPPHAGSLRIDGREYFHGFTYKVKPRSAATMADMQARAWDHDKEVLGQRKPFDSYRLKTSF